MTDYCTSAHCSDMGAVTLTAASGDRAVFDLTKMEDRARFSAAIKFAELSQIETVQDLVGLPMEVRR